MKHLFIVDNKYMHYFDTYLVRNKLIEVQKEHRKHIDDTTCSDQCIYHQQDVSSLFIRHSKYVLP